MVVLKRMVMVLIFGIIMVMGIGFSATAESAEDYGYWTKQIDEYGNQVEVFTYTRQVDYVFDDSSELGRCAEQSNIVMLSDNATGEVFDYSSAVVSLRAILFKVGIGVSILGAIGIYMLICKHYVKA